jgi:hypothetical protein
MSKCIIKTCRNNKYSRGLCMGCYSAANSLIKNKHSPITWSYLESIGLSLPVKVKTCKFKQQLKETQDASSN